MCPASCRRLIISLRVFPYKSSDGVGESFTTIVSMTGEFSRGKHGDFAQNRLLAEGNRRSIASVGSLFVPLGLRVWADPPY